MYDEFAHDEFLMDGEEEEAEETDLDDEESEEDEDEEIGPTFSDDEEEGM